MELRGWNGQTFQRHRALKAVNDTSEKGIAKVFGSA